VNLFLNLSNGGIINFGGRQLIKTPCMDETSSLIESISKEAETLNQLISQDFDLDAISNIMNDTF
jgi:hypothetical protein